MMESNRPVSWPRTTATRVLLILLSLGLVACTGKPVVPIGYFNSADPDKEYPIAQSGDTSIVSVEVAVPVPSNVLVQFTAHATAETSKGCPCSIRAFLRADGGELRPVKRINLGAPAVIDVDKYDHDRQTVDGSLVFPMEAGTHKFELVVRQMTGTSTDLIIYYPNFQAIAFPQ
jgi:hypothetical protein